MSSAKEPRTTASNNLTVSLSQNQAKSAKEPRKKKILFKCALTNTISDVLTNREGWAQTQGDDWQFFWVTREWMNNCYDRHKFSENQLICHFRNDFELTRKDFLIKNYKKARKAKEKSGVDIAAEFNFIPSSYVLPVGLNLYCPFVKKAIVHLTNVAIAKTAADYDPERGLKWSLPKLFRFLRGMHGHSKVSKTMNDLAKVIIESLKSVQNMIIQDNHCFELYGYDILFDENLKPWLLEVNASPSLTASSQEDFELKYRVLNHMLDVLDIEKRLVGTEQQIGGFDILVKNNKPVEICKIGALHSHPFFGTSMNLRLGDYVEAIPMP
uniref:Tubulin--tyrosine ligase-like protein 9 n=1 Tax=Caenorhabditis japonica TaxID=281687 RepID=A0A8R1DNP5_CAEJA